MWPRIHIPPLFRPASYICCACGDGGGGSIGNVYHPHGRIDNGCHHPDYCCPGCLPVNSCGWLLQSNEAEGPHSWDCGACGACAAPVLAILTDRVGCCASPTVATIYDHMGQVLLGPADDDDDDDDENDNINEAETGTGAGGRRISHLQDLVDMQHWLYRCGAWIYLGEVDQVVQESRVRTMDCDITQIPEDGVQPTARAAQDHSATRNEGPQDAMLNTTPAPYMCHSDRDHRDARVNGYDDDDEDKPEQPREEGESTACKRKPRKRKKRSRGKKPGLDDALPITDTNNNSNNNAFPFTTPYTVVGTSGVESLVPAADVNSSPLGPRRRIICEPHHYQQPRSSNDWTAAVRPSLAHRQDENIPLGRERTPHFGNGYDKPSKGEPLREERKRKSNEMIRSDDAIGNTADARKGEDARPRKRARKRKNSDMTNRESDVAIATESIAGPSSPPIVNTSSNLGNDNHDYIGMRGSDREAFIGNSSSRDNGNSNNESESFARGNHGIPHGNCESGGGDGARGSGTNHSEDAYGRNDEHGPDPSLDIQSAGGAKRRRKSRKGKGDRSSTGHSHNNTSGNGSSAASLLDSGNRDWQQPVYPGVRAGGISRNNNNSNSNRARHDDEDNRGDIPPRSKKCDRYVPPFPPPPPPPPPPPHSTIPLHPPIHLPPRPPSPLAESRRRKNIKLSLSTHYDHNNRNSKGDCNSIPVAGDYYADQGPPQPRTQASRKRKATANPLGDDDGQRAKRTDQRTPWTESRWTDRRW